MDHLYSMDIIIYTLTERPLLSMISSMIEEAFEKLPDDDNVILHYNQSWHYRHLQYQRMLKEKGVRQSMNRKGNYLDNAVIVNFFGLLKSALLYLQ